MNTEIEDEVEEVNEAPVMEVTEVLMPYHTTKTVEQRKRKVTYTLFTADAAGLAELVKVVGAEALVNRYQDFYVARNSILSMMDKEDDGAFKGTRTLPAKAKDGETMAEVKFDLTKNFPKPGTRRTKWGELKAFVAQAKEVLEGAGKPTDDESIRKVATKLKAIYDQSKDGLLD